MIRRPPRSTRTDTLFPYTTLFRSGDVSGSGNRSSRRELMTTMRLEPAISAAAMTGCSRPVARSEEHTSELQSLMRISYAVFCLKKKKNTLASNRPNNKIKLKMRHGNDSESRQYYHVENSYDY